MTTPRNAELIEMSKGLYLTVVGLTESPQEGMAVITMMHLTLYLNHGDPASSVDAMLAEYTKNFKKNWQKNRERAT